MITNIWTRNHFLSKKKITFQNSGSRGLTYRPDSAWTAIFVTVSSGCLSQFNKYQLRVKSPHCADLRQIDILKVTRIFMVFLEWSFYLEEALW